MRCSTISTTNGDFAEAAGLGVAAPEADDDVDGSPRNALELAMAGAEVAAAVAVGRRATAGELVDAGAIFETG
ncbi:MAG TPA: hypothetical protein VGQ57_03780 [Polyangiaceae bacterium]|nr:hypothetical protein [Polyangiaceae bacterium]